MIVCILEFGTLIGDARIENKRNIMLQKPFYMSVDKLCRVAFGLAWNRFNPLFVKLMSRLRRKNYLVF